MNNVPRLKASPDYPIQAGMWVDASHYDALLDKWVQLRDWLDHNTTFYNTAESTGPVLAEVSKRIWYHATDDVTSYPFSEVARRAVQPSDGPHG